MARVDTRRGRYVIRSPWSRNPVCCFTLAGTYGGTFNLVPVLDLATSSRRVRLVAVAGRVRRERRGRGSHPVAVASPLGSCFAAHWRSRIRVATPALVNHSCHSIFATRRLPAIQRAARRGAWYVLVTVARRGCGVSVCRSAAATAARPARHRGGVARPAARARAAWCARRVAVGRPVGRRGRGRRVGVAARRAEQRAEQQERGPRRPPRRSRGAPHAERGRARERVGLIAGAAGIDRYGDDEPDERGRGRAAEQCGERIAQRVGERTQRAARRRADEARARDQSGAREE